MKKIVFAVVLVMMLALGAMAQDAAKSTPPAKAHAAKAGTGGDVSKTLMEMETKMAALMQAGDWDKAGAMIDDKCVAVDESGVTDKAGWIKAMSAVKFTEASVSDMKAVPFGDTYIVTGKFNAKGSVADAKEMNMNINWMDTWAKRGGKWKVIATSAASAKM